MDVHEVATKLDWVHRLRSVTPMLPDSGCGAIGKKVVWA